MYEEEPDQDAIRGTCMRMCPIKEIEMRIEAYQYDYDFEADSNDVDHLNRPKPIKDRFVKQYFNMAVGRKSVEPDELRTAPALVYTTEYLVDIMDEKTVYKTHDYVFDRLKAVMQDLVIQRIGHPEKTEILQLAVGAFFYLHHYSSADHRKGQTNERYRQGTHNFLISLMNHYDNMPYKDDDGEVIANKRVYFEAMYVLSNAGTNPVYQRHKTLPEEIREDRFFLKCLNISNCLVDKNYYRCLKLIADLPQILKEAFFLRVAELQLEILRDICSAFKTEYSRMPILELGQLLAPFEKDEGSIIGFVSKLCDVMDWTIDDDQKVVIDKTKLAPNKVVPHYDWESLHSKEPFMNIYTHPLGITRVTVLNNNQRLLRTMSSKIFARIAAKDALRRKLENEVKELLMNRLTDELNKIDINQVEF